MDIGTGIAIGTLVVGATTVSLRVIGSRITESGNDNGNGKKTCPLHETLTEDIREIKEDVKALIKEVAAMGGR